jgi:hypothetical protein
MAEVRVELGRPVALEPDPRAGGVGPRHRWLAPGDAIPAGAGAARPASSAYRTAFRSGDPDLDRFLVKYAGQNQFRHHIGTSYVAVEAGFG